MKIRDSGMPERAFWESLFDVPGMMTVLGVGRVIGSAIEVGCGYGTFTVPIATRISGTLHSFDIDPAMVAATEVRVCDAGLLNVRLSARDVIADGFGLPAETVDAVFLFNILHAEDPVTLMRASAQVLRRDGKLFVVHWRSDVATPRGPDLAIRPRPEQVASWAAETALLATDGGARLLPPWHFGVVFIRQ